MRKLVLFLVSVLIVILGVQIVLGELQTQKAVDNLFDCSEGGDVSLLCPKNYCSSVFGDNPTPPMQPAYCINETDNGNDPENYGILNFNYVSYYEDSCCDEDGNSVAKSTNFIELICNDIFESYTSVFCYDGELVDCFEDEDCDYGYVCSQYEYECVLAEADGEVTCYDDFDNDGDGLIDCEDDNCLDVPCGLYNGSGCVNGECMELECNDGIDNDYRIIDSQWVSGGSESNGDSGDGPSKDFADFLSEFNNQYQTSKNLGDAFKDNAWQSLMNELNEATLQSMINIMPEILEGLQDKGITMPPVEAINTQYRSIYSGQINPEIYETYVDTVDQMFQNEVPINEQVNILMGTGIDQFSASLVVYNIALNYGYDNTQAAGQINTGLQQSGIDDDIINNVNSMLGMTQVSVSITGNAVKNLLTDAFTLNEELIVVNVENGSLITAEATYFFSDDGIDGADSDCEGQPCGEDSIWINGVCTYFEYAPPVAPAPAYEPPQYVNTYVDFLEYLNSGIVETNTASTCNDQCALTGKTCGFADAGMKACSDAGSTKCTCYVTS
ncbi:MAG: hypothetical protein ABIG93_01200 [archaeon]|nr:hypothetical protein [Nanoarchaeota archaeon]